MTRITTEGLGRPTASASPILKECIVQLERDTGEPVPAEQCDPRTAEVRRHLIWAMKEERYSDRWRPGKKVIPHSGNIKSKTHKYAGDVWGLLKGGGRRWCQLGSEGREAEKLRLVLWVAGVGRFLRVTWLDMSLREIMFMEPLR